MIFIAQKEFQIDILLLIQYDIYTNIYTKKLLSLIARYTSIFFCSFLISKHLRFKSLPLFPRVSLLIYVLT